MAVFTDNRLYPTLIVNPDIRYAASFLNAKYRDYAVNGEVLMDKICGEITMKRPNDGRIISFQQNHRKINEVATDLRVMLLNNPAFRYSHSNEAGYYLDTVYDMYLINENKMPNVIEDTLRIDNGNSETNRRLNFQVSIDSNGFFIHPQSRDCDKPLIEFLTNEYNLRYERYKGSDPEELTEYQRFVDDQTWKESNCILSYEVVMEGINSASVKETYSYSASTNIRLNETFCIMFPDEFLNQVIEVTNLHVNIRSFNCYKLQYMYQKKSEFNDEFLRKFESFAYPDNGIELTWCTINTFIDSVNDIDLLNNEWIVTMLNIPYVLRATNKLSKIAGNNAVILSSTRPYADIWTTNTVWAERIFDYGENGTIIPTFSETTVEGLEEYIANMKEQPSEEPEHTKVALNTGEEDDFIIKEVESVIDQS